MVENGRNGRKKSSEPFLSFHHFGSREGRLPLDFDSDGLIRIPCAHKSGRGGLANDGFLKTHARTFDGGQLFSSTHAVSGSRVPAKSCPPNGLAGHFFWRRQSRLTKTIAWPGR